MSWQVIKQNKTDVWNEKLKSTDAEFCQYPYYISSEYNSLFSKAVFLNFVDNKNVLAYAAIIEIGFAAFKFAVLDCGPVLLQNNVNLNILLEALKNYAQQKKYVHLQIRPSNNSALINLLQSDSTFKKEVYFPYHRKVEYDSVIYNKPEKELLAGFKLQCRRKIVLAGRVPFEFKKIESVQQLEEFKKLQKNVAAEKGHKFLPFSVYKNMYVKGKPHNLCDIYGAYLNNKLVNAVLVLKDRLSCYHYISLLVVDGYKANESPPSKLHLFIMKDCFYNEHKQFYNISYGGHDNLIRFKELFNPVEIKKPDYYTYVINGKALKFFSKFSFEKTDSLRKSLKKINDILFHPFAVKK